MEASGGRPWSGASASGPAAAGGVGEGARRRGDDSPRTGRNQVGSGRAAAERALSAGRLEPVPHKLREMGGSEEAKAPGLASGGAGLAWRLRVKPGRPEAELGVCGRMSDK